LKKWQLNDVGMVTDAVWEDIDNDSKERFISGWRLMAPKIFKKYRRLAEYKSNLRNIRVLERS
jgi:hypothetical protein